MRVLVDTNVWSLALRRQPSSLSRVEEAHAEALAVLIREGRVVVVGLVRQELLSGVGDPRRFAELRDRFAAFSDEPLHTADHVRAAEMSNLCRSRGVQSAAIDILLCAVAERLSAAIFTVDTAFEAYSRHLPLELFVPRADA